MLKKNHIPASLLISLAQRCKFRRVPHVEAKPIRPATKANRTLKTSLSLFFEAKDARPAALAMDKNSHPKNLSIFIFYAEVVRSMTCAVQPSGSEPS